MNRTDLRSPRTRPGRIATTLLLALNVAGCQTPSAYFWPAEPTVVETVDHVPGAQFELRDKQGRVGELRVWCLRAEEGEVSDDERRPLTYVDIGLELENNSKEELEFVLGEARLRDVQTSEQRIDSVALFQPSEAPFESGDTVRVAPDSVSTTYMSFELPTGVRPKDIQSFRLQWVVRSSGQRRFTDLTSFVRARRRYHSGRNWGWFVMSLPLWHGHWHH